MGSKLCSKFRKFKKKVFSKKEKYDRLEEPEPKEDLPPADNQVDGVPVDVVKNEETVVLKQEQSSELRDKETIIKTEQIQEPSVTHEDIESWIVILEEQLENISSICSGRKTEERQDIYNSLGAAYYRTCDFQMSKKYYEMYFKTIPKRGSLELLQRAHCNLGCVYRRLGEFEQAEQHFRNGLEISEELQDMKSKGRLLNNLGNIFEMKKDFERAIYYHAQRRKVAETLGDWEGEAKACASLGNAYHIIGNLRASIVFYERVVIWLKRKYCKYRYHVSYQRDEKEITTFLFDL
ncbi:hypothetical protein QZH41_004297 [Actinostola sp. cb2023]|nr:hypothetical protein QZH41_004297 [Actinostola sp. cb2023]